jgi:hypothetical protein
VFLEVSWFKKTSISEMCGFVDPGSPFLNYRYFSHGSMVEGDQPSRFGQELFLHHCKLYGESWALRKKL